MAHVLFAADGLSGACYEAGLNCTAIPAGCADVPDEAWADFRRFPGSRRWDGARVVLYVPTVSPADAAQAVADAVGIERDRRLALGVAYAGHTYQTRDFDIANMTGAATAAVAAMMQGAQAGDLRWASAAADFAWIDIANVAVPMDAPMLIGLAQAAMNRRAALIFAARAIKDRIAAGATLTIGDDALWPT